MVPRKRSKKAGQYTVFTVAFPRLLQSEARQLVGAWVVCARCRRAGPVVALRPLSRRQW